MMKFSETGFAGLTLIETPSVTDHRGSFLHLPSGVQGTAVGTVPAATAPARDHERELDLPFNAENRALARQPAAAPTSPPS